LQAAIHKSIIFYDHFFSVLYVFSDNCANFIRVDDMDKQERKPVFPGAGSAAPLFSRPIRTKRMRRTLRKYN